ncbi:MAG: tRNA (N(6)-L-threonylcarbamoyladenosine(37)-C(2))-methylthiotransferase [Candidatus Diapherotrites archaeon]|nr:tRNA (N(6)-L-threonylcarbamoyladenosine(37)-C(2))-methylthiotransferase [Candidatus Diapherotrites archaeon]
MKAYVESYGCALNHADANILKSLLRKHGAEITDSPEDAGIMFLNTCAVKLPTERRMIDRIKEMDSGNLVVCGCLPAVNLKEIRKISDCTVMDTNSFGRIGDILDGARGDFFSSQHANKLLLPQAYEGPVAVIPCSEGCLGACAYCGTKNARGDLTSYPAKEVKAAVEKAVASGAKEIQLTAQDMGVYGRDIGTTLPELLREVCSVDGSFRVRVGMSNPNAVRKMLAEYLDAFSEENVYKFFHVPVQSGSDAVLRRMRRPYTAAEFKEVVNAIRKRFPDAVIATDVIVGFPGETAEDFGATQQLIRECGFEVVNISKFFPRPRTEAAGMKKTPTHVAKQRSVACAELCAEVSAQRNERFVGREWDVTVLSERENGGFVARAPNYRRAILDEVSIGERVRVRIIKSEANYLVGEAVERLADRRHCQQTPEEGHSHHHDDCR